jgi:hypothetical protein
MDETRVYATVRKLLVQRGQLSADAELSRSALDDVMRQEMATAGIAVHEDMSVAANWYHNIVASGAFPMITEFYHSTTSLLPTSAPAPVSVKLPGQTQKPEKYTLAPSLSVVSGAMDIYKRGEWHELQQTNATCFDRMDANACVYKTPVDKDHPNGRLTFDNHPLVRFAIAYASFVATDRE